VWKVRISEKKFTGVTSIKDAKFKAYLEEQHTVKVSSIVIETAEEQETVSAV
jgi:hypothetical protein